MYNITESQKQELKTLMREMDNTKKDPQTRGAIARKIGVNFFKLKPYYLKQMSDGQAMSVVRDLYNKGVYQEDMTENRVEQLLNECVKLASTPYKESDLRDDLIRSKTDKNAGSAMYINKEVIEDTIGDENLKEIKTEKAIVDDIVGRLIYHYNKNEMDDEDMSHILDAVEKEIFSVGSYKK